MRIIQNQKNRKTILATAIIVFAFFAVFGFSLLTGNQQDSGVDTSSASAQEPADINSDNVVDIVDLSILLSNWNTNDNLSDINNDNIVDIVDLSILLSKWGVVVTEPTNTGVYGPAYNLDALQNVIIGSSLDRKASHRFQSTKTGSVVSVRWWSKNYPGYGAGDGGEITITIQSDNGSGEPSGNVLGNGVAVSGAVGNTYPLVLFPTPISIMAGTLYHIVYENTGGDPVNNYTSVNNTMCFDSQDPYQPKWPDDSFDTLAKDGSGPWRRFYNATPIVDITFEDGSHYGQGFNDYRYGQDITGGIMLREKYIVSGSNKYVTGIAVRIAKTSGIGELEARLEHKNGTLIESVNMSTENVPILDSGANGRAGIWVSGELSQTRTLTMGETYYVRFSTDSNTVLWTRPIQVGISYGWDPSLGFKDGIAEYSSDGGSTWGVLPNGLDLTSTHIQTYLMTK